MKWTSTQKAPDHATAATFVGVALLALHALRCTTSPSASPSGSASGSAPAERSALSVPSSVAPDVQGPPQRSDSHQEHPPPVDRNAEPRVSAWWPDGTPNYMMQFPRAISKDGDRIAALVSVADNSEVFHLQWLVIKNVKTDRIDRELVLIDEELSSELAKNCRHGPVTCIHREEVERRVQAANSELAKRRWRPFPCVRDLGLDDENRFDPGCERFRELEMHYDAPRFRLRQGERVIVNQHRPEWGYHGRSCKKYMSAGAESLAFDPETAIFVAGIYFSAGVEGCNVPTWDFHAVRLPMLRDKPPPRGDGGAP